jgi:hypothetical protein
MQRKKEALQIKISNAQVMSLGTTRYTGQKELRRFKYYHYWAIFLCFLKFLNAISITIIYGLYYSTRPSERSKTLSFLFLFSTRFLLWISDFFTMTTLIYIFF